MGRGNRRAWRGREEEGGKKKRRDVDDGEWRKVGEEGVNVVGVIPLLGPVALTLTVA